MNFCFAATSFYDRTTYFAARQMMNFHLRSEGQTEKAIAREPALSTRELDREGASLGLSSGRGQYVRRSVRCLGPPRCINVMSLSAQMPFACSYFWNVDFFFSGTRFMTFYGRWLRMPPSLTPIPAAPFALRLLNISVERVCWSLPRSSFCAHVSAPLSKRGRWRALSQSYFLSIVLIIRPVQVSFISQLSVMWFSSLSLSLLHLGIYI